MKSKKKYLGGIKNIRGEKQVESSTGRNENVAAKQSFKVGPQARTDSNAGRQTPLVKADQVAVPPAKERTP